MSTIGSKIQERRKELGWTQEELAAKMGYKSKSSINKIELGINDIPQSKIVLFAEALNTTPAYLMGWENEQELLISERVSKVIKGLRGDQSLRAFADKCGVSHTTIDNLEKGLDARTGKPTQVKLSTLARIFEACNVPSDMAYLAMMADDGASDLFDALIEGNLYGTSNGDGTVRKFGPSSRSHLSMIGANVRPVSRKRLPMLGNVACGEPTFADEQHDTFVDAVSDVGADFCLTAKGDSMINARIFDGDILFVKQQESVDDGEIAVVLIEDETTVKRVYYDKENNVITLMPENPTHKPMRFEGAKLEQIRILGKVVAGQYVIK